MKPLFFILRQVLALEIYFCTFSSVSNIRLYLWVMTDLSHVFILHITSNMAVSHWYFLQLMGFQNWESLAQCLFKVRHIYIFNILKKDFKLQCMLKPGVLTVWNVYPIAGTIFRHSWTLGWGILQRRESRWRHHFLRYKFWDYRLIPQIILSTFGFSCESEDR